MYDYLIVAPVSTVPYSPHEAKKAGKKVLVIDRRPNIAGNVYTEPMEAFRFTSMARIFSTRIIRKSGIM